MSLHQKLEQLIASWPDDRGDPPDTDYQRGYMAAAAEHARELAEALAADAGGWRPNTKDAPQEPYAWIILQVEEVFRWAPYKPAAVHQMRKPGRWQKLNDYGGFDNAELPDGACWKPHHPPQEPQP